MARVNIRVKIPRKAPELISLLNKVLAKHEADGERSPLNSVNMDDLTAKTRVATVANEDAFKLKKQSEAAFEDRNLALGLAKGQISTTTGTANYYVKAIRDILLGLYKGREHQLGEWGFEVNHSPKAKPAGETAAPANGNTATA